MELIDHIRKRLVKAGFELLELLKFSDEGRGQGFLITARHIPSKVIFTKLIRRHDLMAARTEIQEAKVFVTKLQEMVVDVGISHNLKPVDEGKGLQNENK